MAADTEKTPAACLADVYQTTNQFDVDLGLCDLYHDSSQPLTAEKSTWTDVKVVKCEF